jgi:hypothetical protein
VYGGKGYFCDQPIERWMRDARINTIGEGANDVLKAFIAVVGCKGPGMHLKELRDDMLGGRWSLRKIGQSLGVVGKLTVPWLAASTPDVPVKATDLRDDAHTLAKLTREFGLKLPHVFMAAKTEENFAVAELVHERIADIAIDLYVSACVLARLDHILAGTGTNGKPGPADPYADPVAGKYFLKLAFRRIRERFAALDDNDDASLHESAKSTIAKF